MRVSAAALNHTTNHTIKYVVENTKSRKSSIVQLDGQLICDNNDDFYSAKKARIVRC